MALGGGWADVASSGWQTFTTLQGLADLSVYDVIEDRAENLWFATSFGVSRYDGLNWRTFTTQDGLAHNGVLAILEDRAGNLWFGTDGGGVSRWNGSSWRTFTTADGLASNRVTSVLEDREGNYWFGTDGGGVSRHDGITWRTFTAANGLPGNRVLAMIEDRDGILWFGTTVGLSRHDPSVSTWRTLSTAEGLAGNYVLALLEDRSKDLWVACAHFAGSVVGAGVSRFDGTSWQTFTMADGLSRDLVFSLLEDRSGNIWFGTYQGGVSRYDGAHWRTFSYLDGLTGDWVRAITQDRSGNLWFGTNEWGVSRYDGSTWRTVRASDGLASSFAGDVLEDRSGNLWFSTTDWRGVSRFDGSGWRTFTTADGLAENQVQKMLEDGAGDLWFGTNAGGVSRFDGSVWHTFTTADGLASNGVRDIVEDQSGNLWLAGGFAPGYVLSRYDGSTWTRVTPGDLPAGGIVTAMAMDHDGALWIATSSGGVRIFDGTSWHKLTTADGLASNRVFDVLEARDGSLWFATDLGVSRYDRSSWRTFTAADGLVSNEVSTLLEDRAGHLWFGSFQGVSRFDGVTWTTYSETDGLAENHADPRVEDRHGGLWFATEDGATRYEPDRVAPRTVFLAKPPAVSPTATLGALFIAAFEEARGIEFSHRLDDEPWSAWSRVGAWTASAIPDGPHALAVRARDHDGNLESIPSLASFDVDASPPIPVLEAPTFGEPVRGTLTIRGTAADSRFAWYRLASRPAASTSWDPPVATVLTESSTSVNGGSLATWDTSALPDGDYELRVSVSDTLGLTGTAQVSVIVDNHAPFVDVTAPAKVSAATGGDIYTTNAELHLYFPPHAFRDDALATVVTVPPDSVPATLPSGASRVLAGFEIGWGTAALVKPARLEVSFASVDPTPASGTLALHVSTDGASWRRLGGTVDGGARRITLAITEPGRYALFAGGTEANGGRALSTLSFTPRVFSPTGGFADREVGIGFTLGQASAVTVRVYSRAGWLVREVASGVSLGPGANLVRWDGRDRAGAVVTDGLYLVSVEALGQSQTKTLAVVR